MQGGLGARLILLESVIGLVQIDSRGNCVTLDFADNVSLKRGGRGSAEPIKVEPNHRPGQGLAMGFVSTTDVHSSLDSEAVFFSRSGEN